MNRSLQWVSPAFAVLAWAGGAFGQFPTTGYQRPPTAPYQRPVVSPYINLARPGDAAVNYYGIVRPEFALFNANQNLQQQINLVGQEAAAAETSATFPTTGHTVGFLNYSHYFPTNRPPGLMSPLANRPVQRQQTPAASTPSRTPGTLRR